MHRLLIVAALAASAAACPREPVVDDQPVAAVGPAAATTAGSAKEKAVPTEIVTKKLPVGEPLRLAESTPTFTDIVKASPDEFVCVDQVLAEEDRVIATSSPDCFRKPKGLKWSLFATEKEAQLLTFDRFLGYSDTLDMIMVKGGVPVTSRNLTKKLPDGRQMARTISTSRLTTFVSLSDGSTQQVEGDLGDDHYTFVEGRKQLIVSGYEPPFGNDRDVKITVVNGIPAKRPTLQTSTTITPRDEVTWDADREVFVYRARECRKATLAKDGSKVTCEVNLPTELSNNGRLYDDWFVASPRDQQPLAIDLKTGDQSNPAEGLCAKPFYPHVPREHVGPSLLIACTGEGRRAYEATTMHLWTPETRLEVPGSPWNPSSAGGDFVEFYKLGLALGRGPTRWLDLERHVMWDVGENYLAGRYIATDNPPLDNTRTKAVFSIDSKTPQLRPLATLECEMDLQVVYEDNEVVSVACTKKSVKGQGCGKDKRGTPFEYVMTWDLKNGKQLRSEVPLVGVTKSSLVYADTPFLGSRYVPCEPSKLMSVPR